jgi:HPt (histidine-containing phosphotransfer) domain-containing protein
MLGAASRLDDPRMKPGRFARTQTLDRELFDSLRIDLGDEAMSNLVMLFSERAPQLRELGRAVRRDDGPDLVKLAHSLRGGAAILAAKRLAELAEELEQRGLAGSLEDGTERLANEATIEFERSVSVMRAALAIPAQQPAESAAADSAAEVSRAG